MDNIRDEIERDVLCKPHVSRTHYDVQKLRLERLMQCPEKQVIIPDKFKERGPPTVPDLVRNVMGSSAGAGSGEFHVYRHLRRKEYARQNFMRRRADWEQQEASYHEKIAENKRKFEEVTSKRRAKRLRKKNNRRLNDSTGTSSSSGTQSTKSDKNSLDNDDASDDGCDD